MRAQSELFKDLLSPLGFQITYSEERPLFDLKSLSRADLLIIMGLDWSIMDSLDKSDWEDPSKARRYEPLGEKHWQSIQNYLENGKPLFCHHTGLISFDERKELEEVYDGRWIVGQSTHPPIHEFEVKVVNITHPIMKGLESFKTTDELYNRLRTPRRSEVLLQTNYEGRDCPMAWAGKYGNSRVVCSTLGHDLKAYKSPMIRKFLVNTVQWLVQK
jgi:type 1 glutamine amidotransferase